MRVFVVGMGIISPTAIGVDAFRSAVDDAACGIGSLTLFAEVAPLPVGQIRTSIDTGGFPRTHALALAAAREALAQAPGPVDAVMLGGTTGGMLATEAALEAGVLEPEPFRYHGTGSVAEVLARECRCRGPVVTVSTACSSGGAAVKLALEFLREAPGRRALAGGADCLCRLTYHGFRSLQLVDATGAHPFDRDRRGMSVGEGAAVLVMISAETPPANALAEILGGGLSCDAFHPTAPHPDGAGAVRAIRAALSAAGVLPADVGCINLHGTGTVDNDRSEARALNQVFGVPGPPSSSLKGAMGHPLAAAGAVQAVASVLTVSRGVMPANVGCRVQDPEIQLTLEGTPAHRPVQTVLSNSFGFGGNNAALVFGAPGGRNVPAVESRRRSPLRAAAGVCLTGAGGTDETLERFAGGRECTGTLSMEAVSAGIPSRIVRRFKRLSRMALSLAVSARNAGEPGEAPAAVFWGTGWGPLSETHDFLDELFATDKKFASPTDFVGSVHNAPAGHIALHFDAQGPNITTTGGDASFEQALFSASLIARDIDGPFLVVGADEYHHRFSSLFDPSAAMAETPSDGGGALWIRGKEDVRASDVSVFPAVLSLAEDFTPVDMVHALGGARRIVSDFAAVFVDMPAAWRQRRTGFLEEFLSLAGFGGILVDMRRNIGEFASASAAAVALAVESCRRKTIPAPPDKGTPLFIEKQGVLVLGLGLCLSAVEVTP